MSKKCTGNIVILLLLLQIWFGVLITWLSKLFIFKSSAEIIITMEFGLKKGWHLPPEANLWWKFPCRSLDRRLQVLLQARYKLRDTEHADAFILGLPNLLYFLLAFLLKTHSKVGHTQLCFSKSIYVTKYALDSGKYILRHTQLLVILSNTTFKFSQY